MEGLIVFLLTAMDFVLDVFTLGGWSRWQGGKRIGDEWE